MAMAASSALRRLLRAEARAKEEAREGNECTGENERVWGVKWRAEARRSLTGRANGSERLPRGGQGLTAVGH